MKRLRHLLGDAFSMAAAILLVVICMVFDTEFIIPENSGNVLNIRMGIWEIIDVGNQALKYFLSEVLALYAITFVSFLCTGCLTARLVKLYYDRQSINTTADKKE